jgi:uncharacterized ferritin-like protein (DUF455 family)
VSNNFFSCCKKIILLTNVGEKCQASKQLYHEWHNSSLDNLYPTTSVTPIPIPGRPAKPNLVPPLAVPKRKLGSAEGHARLIHALAHIEFNAINLALDACYRFQHMPQEYYQNWLQVTVDEVYHFELLDQHLLSLGYSYGCFDAHNGLWDMAVKTDSDVLLRMALVPRVLEARGIDAVPEMQKKIAAIGDSRGVEILEIIYRDEIKHVQYGDKWFKYICQARGLNHEATFLHLLQKYNAPKIRGAFNRVDRKKAGFSYYELEQLSKL